MKPPKHVFATFPKFSKLTLADREKWEELIAGYPPIAQISFAELMTWWNVLDSVRVAQLNGNLVISYWRPGDEDRTGLALIGTRLIDESTCAIFDWQRSQGDEARLVAMPEFVVNKIHYPDLFTLEAERLNDECILEVDSLASIDSIPGFKKSKIKRSLADISERPIGVDEIDLEIQANKDLLIEKIESWGTSGDFNNIGTEETEYLLLGIKNGPELGFGCTGLWIDDELEAFLIQYKPSNPRYENDRIIAFARFNYDRKFLFELSVFKFAEWYQGQGIQYVNIDSDLGLQSLRAAKLQLTPHNFFRKYTIKPKA